jgi:predicted Rossmann fold nucleotide-binding protein DprA/Smf involved in DNA uptake
MFARDRYIVDKSDVLLCYLRKKSGGTYYTYKYAEELEKEIIII